MASNYENEEDLKNTVKEKLNDLDDKAIEAIKKALTVGNNDPKNASANIKAVEKIDPKEIAKNTDVVSSKTGGDVDLSKVDASTLQNLNAVQFSGTDKVDLKIDSNAFKGTVILGDGDSKVTITSKKSVTVETGAGNDSITTGSGKDSVVLSGGNDSINTGAGNDTVSVADTGLSGSSIVDGGVGKDTLDLSNASTSTITTNSSGELVVTIGSGSIAAKNFEALVLSDSANVDLSGLSSSIAIVSGTGADSITLGAGKDSVTLTGGNDSVSTGAGDDLVKLSQDFTDSDVTLDGGAGKDKLDLRYESIHSVETADGVTTITLDDGSTVTLTHIEQVVYDRNGDSDGGITTVGINTLDNLF